MGKVLPWPEKNEQKRNVLEGTWLSPSQLDGMLDETTNRRKDGRTYEEKKDQMAITMI